MTMQDDIVNGNQTKYDLTNDEFHQMVKWQWKKDLYKNWKRMKKFMEKQK